MLDKSLLSLGLCFFIFDIRSLDENNGLYFILTKECSCRWVCETKTVDCSGPHRSGRWKPHLLIPGPAPDYGL